MPGIQLGKGPHRDCVRAHSAASHQGFGDENVDLYSHRALCVLKHTRLISFHTLCHTINKIMLLKPANILIRKVADDPNSWNVKLADFGLSRSVRSYWVSL